MCCCRDCDFGSARSCNIFKPNSFLQSDCRYSLETRFGITSVSWARDGATGTVSINVTVPIGSVAEVVHDQHLPGTKCELASVLETGHTVWSIFTDVRVTGALPEGLVSVTRYTGTVSTVIGSGQYYFSARYNCE